MVFELVYVANGQGTCRQHDDTEVSKVGAPGTY